MPVIYRQVWLRAGAGPVVGAVADLGGGATRLGEVAGIENCGFMEWSIVRDCCSFWFHGWSVGGLRDPLIPFSFLFRQRRGGKKEVGGILDGCLQKK